MYDKITKALKKYFESKQFLTVNIKKDEHIKYKGKLYVDTDGYYITSMKVDRQIYRSIIVFLLICVCIISTFLVIEKKNNNELRDITTKQWYEINALRSIHQIQEQEIIIEKEAKATLFGLFKSYMDYRAITNKTSIQYRLQEVAHTDFQGLRRLDNYYMVATGSFYGDVGTLYKITLSSGVQFEAVKGDAKSDKHTDEENKICLQNGSVIEFIVDMSYLQFEARQSGDISSIGFEGSIESIERIGDYELE